MIYYCCKDITPLKVSLSKIIFEVQKVDNTKTLKQSLFLNQTIRPLKTNETGRKKPHTLYAAYEQYILRLDVLTNDRTIYHCIFLANNQCILPHTKQTK